MNAFEIVMVTFSQLNCRRQYIHRMSVTFSCNEIILLACIRTHETNIYHYLLLMDIDGYDNYSGDEEFNEDSLTNEEYDTLYEILPELKLKLELYNAEIDELSMKEALYYNYFELEPAVEELQSKFPKKKGMLILLK